MTMILLLDSVSFLKDESFERGLYRQHVSNWCEWDTVSILDMLSRLSNEYTSLHADTHMTFIQHTHTPCTHHTHTNTRERDRERGGAREKERQRFCHLFDFYVGESMILRVQRCLNQGLQCPGDQVYCSVTGLLA